MVDVWWRGTTLGKYVLRVTGRSGGDEVNTMRGCIWEGVTNVLLVVQEVISMFMRFLTGIIFSVGTKGVNEKGTGS